MKLIYPAVFHKEDDSVWVEFPDLIGCQSFGDNVQDAYENAKEALEAYCITMLEEKHELPKACDITSIHTENGTFTSLVETDLTTQMSKMKSVKKTLTIPMWMNEMAENQGINFSQTLQNALKTQLGL